jgi:hypothetical protein
MHFSPYYFKNCAILKLIIRINAYQYGSLLSLKGILGEKKILE